MRRKERLRRAGTILMAIGAGGLGVMLGTVLYLFAPDLIPLPPTRTPEPAPTFTLGPTATATSVWTVTYEYRFLIGALESGRTRYEIEVQCPSGAYSGTWSGEVTVSGAAEIARRRVYLRSTGVYDEPLAGTRVSVVHPEQPLGAAANLRFNSLAAAESARGSCSATVSWSGGPPQKMEPGIARETRGD